MEIDRYILSLQRVLNIRSSYTDFDPEKDMDLLTQIVSSIRTECPFLETESSQCGKDENARKVHAALFLHSELETSKYYVDNDELACIVGILPKLSPAFYLLLINKLKLNEYLKELLFYSSEVVSNHVLEVLNKNIKYYELDQTLQLYENIIKIIYLKLKYLELDYHGKNMELAEQMKNLALGTNQTKSDADIKAATKAKYVKYLQNFKIFGFEFCNNLLNNSKLKSFENDESIIFEGYLLLSHLQILIFCTNVECFQNNGESPKFNSKQCIQMTQDIQEFYLPFKGEEDFDYAKEWNDNSLSTELDLFQDCYGDLLYDLIKVLSPISSNSWFIFYEHKYSNGNTLQTEIGEHAYYLNELLKQAMAKGYEHTNIKQITSDYLQHLCIKPVTEEDLILKSLPEQLIPAFQENSPIIKNRPKWLNSALRFFNSHHDEIMSIFESNLCHVNCETVFCLHDMIMDRLCNEDLDLSEQETCRLKQLLLNSLDHLPINDQVKVVVTFVEKYQEELSSVFGGSEQSGETEEWLNVINNQSSLDQVYSTSLKHLLQAPHTTLTKLMNICLKSKLDQSCVALVIQCLVDTILPHFGSLDLRQSESSADQDGGKENGDQDGGRSFLLDYFSDVLDQVKVSLEMGEVSFTSCNHDEDDDNAKQTDVKSPKGSTLDLKSLSKLSQQDISNLKPMISLLYKKQVLSPAELYFQCLWPEFRSADSNQYEYWSFVTDLLLIHFQDPAPLAWSPSDELLRALFSLVRDRVNQCTCSMGEFLKEKYFARQQLILLMTSLLQRHADNLDLSDSPEMPHPDWLKLFLNKTDSLDQLYDLQEDSHLPFLCQFLSRASQAEWTTLASRMSSEECLLILDAIRVLVQLVESRTRDPGTVEPYVNCLHQTMICFTNVLKVIFLPRLLKASNTLPSSFKLDLFASITSLLASFKSSSLDQVKMFTILSLESLLSQLLRKLFKSSEVREHEKYLCVLTVRIDYVQTRVKLVKSIQTCRG